MCLNFFIISDSSDDVIRPCLVLTNSEKNVRFPNMLLDQDFFIDLIL